MTGLRKLNVTLGSVRPEEVLRDEAAASGTGRCKGKAVSVHRPNGPMGCNGTSPQVTSTFLWIEVVQRSASMGTPHDLSDPGRARPFDHLGPA